MHVMLYKIALFAHCLFNACHAFLCIHALICTYCKESVTQMHYLHPYAVHSYTFERGTFYVKVEGGHKYIACIVMHVMLYKIYNALKCNSRISMYHAQNCYNCTFHCASDDYPYGTMFCLHNCVLYLTCFHEVSFHIFIEQPFMYSLNTFCRKVLYLFRT